MVTTMNEATTKALRNYLNTLRYLKKEVDHPSSKLFSLYDEFLGVLEDERHFNPGADHSYSDFLQTLVYELAQLPKKERAIAMNLLIQTLSRMVN